ncbi:MAG TPA: hypothetical protein DD670_13255 [Planctomycetaceae bacterium]|nr:hypothetical protein [Planctomycetaceae bacterium]
MSRFLVVLAGAFALLAAALPGAASAELIYYVEDFEHNGEPGFDPMFNHEFTAKPGGTLRWRLGTQPDGTAYLFLGSGTTDTITFNLPSWGTVTYATVCLHPDFPLGQSTTSVTFVGSEGTWVSGPDDYGQTFVDITANEIGVIEQIQLYASQAAFTSVTIGMVPEPTNAILLLGFVTAGTLRASGRRRRV